MQSKTSPTTKLIIPEIFMYQNKEYIRTRILEKEYSEQTVEIIEVPNTVNEIKDEAFSFCTNLKKIKYSDNVSYIGKDAFIGCKNLKSILIPKNMIHFKHRICFNCENLTEIIWNSDIKPNKEIINIMFENCPKLKIIKYKGQNINIHVFTEKLIPIILNKKNEKKYKQIITLKKLKNLFCNILNSIIFFFLFILGIWSHWKIGPILCCLFIFIITLFISITNFIMIINQKRKKTNFYISKVKIEKLETNNTTRPFEYTSNYLSDDRYLFTFLLPWKTLEEKVVYSGKFINKLNGNYDIICDDKNKEYIFISKKIKNLSYEKVLL